MLPLLFFVADFGVYAYYHEWYLYSLLIYFMYAHLNFPRSRTFKLFSIALLLIQDYFLHGRFGFGLLYILPIIGCNEVARRAFHSNLIVITHYVLLVGVLLIDNFVVKTLVFGQNLAFQSTMIKIFINVMVLSLILAGTWGNRSLPFLTARRGKSGHQTGKAPYKKFQR